ncbi:MAG: hypothetical protein AAGJ96_06250 [Pseudomonadota bacterium]
MARVQVHVGLVKTGTTTLQQSFAHARGPLAVRGVRYPGNALNHRASARELVRSSRFAGGVERVLGEVGPGESVLLSSEAFSTIATSPKADPEDRARYLDRLRARLAGHDVEIILVLRRPDALLEAAYAETILSSPNAPPFRAFLKARRQRFDLAGQLRLWEERFEVKTLIFEELCAKGLVQAFWKALDLGDPPSVPAPVRLTPPPAAIAWLRRAKRAGAMSPQERKRRWLFLRQDENAPHFEREGGFWRSARQREAAIARCLGGLDPGRFPPSAPLAPRLQWSDADHAAVEAAFLDWQRAYRGWIASREAAKIPPYQG